MNTITRLVFFSSAAIGAALAAVTASAQSTQRVSIGSGADGDTQFATISADGRFVAFASGASNLVAGDTNNADDLFVRDVANGTTERVDIASNGAVMQNVTHEAAISGDGRFVAFIGSDSATLISGVWLRDRTNGTTTLVSSDFPGFGSSSSPSISADGRYVAFASTTTNLVVGDTNNAQDIFVRDLLAGTTERVSVPTGGGQANADSSLCSISADGRYVAFSSAATNLVANDTNGVADAFVHDRVTGTTERVSVSTNGVQANAPVVGPVRVSADGSFVVFTTASSTLVPGDMNNNYDVFLRDRTSGTTEIVSVATNGTASDGISGSGVAAISSDGRFVAFASNATTLVPGATGVSQAYVRDRTSGTTVLASISSDGGFANDFVQLPSISGDGSVIAYWAAATNIVHGDTNGHWDAFSRDLVLGSNVLASAASVQGNSSSDKSSISADGRFVVFESNASNLVASDTNGVADVFLHDRASGETEIVSLAPGSAPANGPSHTPVVSADGRYVAFLSEATNLLSQPTSSVGHVFRHDRITQQNQLVSQSSAGQQGNGPSGRSAISGDGRFVAFESAASNLVPGDTNGQWDIFVRDMVDGTTERVSVDSGGVEANAESHATAISGDGRFVCFVSSASNLVPGDTNGFADVFVHDRQTGTTARVNVDSNGAQANNESDQISMSADGRFITFSSTATNLVPGDTNGFADVFVHDRQTGTTERVSVDSNGVQGNSDSIFGSISADGRYVSFPSYASNLVPGDTNGVNDVFVRDRLAGTTERVDVATDGSQPNQQAHWGTISGDGRFVTFPCEGTNLVPNDTNGATDIFVRDRGVGSVSTPFCFGDGSGAACPCANNGSAGHGCNNSSATGGGLLFAFGLASLANDSLHFTAQNEKPAALSIVNQGDATISALPFGQGLRCVGGHLKRLYSHTAVAGTITAPSGMDLPVHTRAAALGDTILPGATRSYYVYYRDATVLGGCSSAATFNTTESVAVTWGS